MRSVLLTRRAALAGAASLAAPHVRAASARRVIFSSVGGLTDAPFYIGSALGLWAEAGLDVQMMKFSSAPELMTATATSQVDASGISVTPGLFAAVQRGLKLRLVGDKQSLRPGFSATRLILKPALMRPSEAEMVAAMKGRKIALSARPSAVTMLLDDLMRKHGASLADIDVVELAYPNMFAALTTGAVEGAIDLEPFLSQAITAGLATHACDFTEFVPAAGGSIVPLVYSEGFIADRGRAQDFMTCYMRCVRLYNDAFVHGKDRERMIAITAKGAGIDEAAVRASYPAGLDPDQQLDRGFIDRLQRFFVRQKMLAQTIDLDGIIDTSFAEAARAALGPYV